MGPWGIKASFVLGGIFFLMLGGALMVLTSNTQEGVLFICLGLCCFFGLDWYNARQPPVVIRHMDDEVETPTQSAPVVVTITGAEAGAEMAGGGGGGGTGHMNHLEYADSLFQRVVEAPNEEGVVELLEKGMADVVNMGYTDKGITAFLNKLGGNLAAMNNKQFPEQAMKNRGTALATLAKLRNIEPAN